MSNKSFKLSKRQREVITFGIYEYTVEYIKDCINSDYLNTSEKLSEIQDLLNKLDYKINNLDEYMEPIIKQTESRLAGPRP